MTEIGHTAFYGYKSLTSIVILDSVVEIGNDVFLCCSSLSKIVISNALLFKDARVLEGVEIVTP